MSLALYVKISSDCDAIQSRNCLHSVIVCSVGVDCCNASALRMSKSMPSMLCVRKRKMLHTSWINFCPLCWEGGDCCLVLQIVPWLHSLVSTGDKVDHVAWMGGDAGIFGALCSLSSSWWSVLCSPRSPKQGWVHNGVLPPSCTSIYSIFSHCLKNVVHPLCWHILPQIVDSQAGTDGARVMLPHAGGCSTLEVPPVSQGALWGVPGRLYPPVVGRTSHFGSHSKQICPVLQLLGDCNVQ